MPIELYRCVICGEIWSSYSEAEKCEASHKKAVAIFDQKFSHEENHRKYPQTVIIRADDGCLVKYTRG